MSPPRSDCTSATPCRSNSAGGESRCPSTIPRLPSVITGGCSTSSNCSSPPATTCACTCSWMAQASRYGSSPRSRTSIGGLYASGGRQHLRRAAGQVHLHALSALRVRHVLLPVGHIARYTVEPGELL